LKHTQIGQKQRALLLTLLTLASFVLLTGCTGTLYDDRVPIPFLSEGIYTHYIAQLLLIGALHAPIAGVAAWVLWPVIFPPYFRLKVDGLKIELWASRRKFPWASRTGSVVVPVAPDLKMVFGSAKIIRDWGANYAQYEAEQIAPLNPGEAFVGTGARYRWQRTGLAVIFDNQKRTNSELITTALHNAFHQLSKEGITSALVPDLTENLISQPNWITAEQREATTRQAARLLLDAIVASRGDLEKVHIWVFDPDNADIFVEEMEKWNEERRSHATAH
jgi:hypothetical protein